MGHTVPKKQLKEKTGNRINTCRNDMNKELLETG